MGGIPTTQSRLLKFDFKNHQGPQSLLREYAPPEEPKTVSEYFGMKYPYAKRFGPPFLEAVEVDQNGFTTSTPVYLCDDFFAGVLAGDKRLGHDLVHLETEDKFYFFDSRIGCYCPTTEDKVIFW